MYAGFLWGNIKKGNTWKIWDRRQDNIKMYLTEIIWRSGD
jgi:hypothetical protein